MNAELCLANGLVALTPSIISSTQLDGGVNERRGSESDGTTNKTVCSQFTRTSVSTEQLRGHRSDETFQREIRAHLQDNDVCIAKVTVAQCKRTRQS